jgi:spore coat polysaccharide biosynthesis predicted glycosyltransferase SpsG
VQTDIRVFHYHSIDENEMLALMRTSDLAIVPASSVMIETLSQKMVVISGYYIKNQKKAYAAALNDQLIFGIGDFFKFTKQLLEKKLFEIENKITNGELVHARIGSDKLVNAFKSLT